MIEKPGKDHILVEVYRPISLLNIDYKILAIIMAERLQSGLVAIIHPDQVGFVKQRYLRDNISKVVKLIDHDKREKLSMVLFFTDAEKAYDRMEWVFLKNVLEKIGLGDKLRNTMEAIYKYPIAKLLINGQLSGFQGLFTHPDSFTPTGPPPR